MAQRKEITARRIQLKLIKEGETKRGEKLTHPRANVSSLEMQEIPMGTKSMGLLTSTRCES